TGAFSSFFLSRIAASRQQIWWRGATLSRHGAICRLVRRDPRTALSGAAGGAQRLSRAGGPGPGDRRRGLPHASRQAATAARGPGRVAVTDHHRELPEMAEGGGA